ncbi:MAG: glutamine--fructose-6-phosphate transaminase (isomerizing) [Chloroflexi bacterium]|nr:MAG: glutamine--fructose-6-phosphate transaminase (isomerizing) [Chloroflexota bacterium]
MCGIIGYAGPRLAAPILLDSLRRLEYRGYDSAGLAILDADGGVSAVKINHKVAELARQIEREGTPPGTVGIGHTRWATHGRPSVENAHPHQDCTGRIHLIHNGIIENFRELRTELEARGHEFMSDTDTEVVPHLIEDHYRGDLAAAVRAALRRIRGAYALVVVCTDQPDRIVGARLNAPLVVGLGSGEVFVSSDITALIPYTKRVALIGEGQVVTATPAGIAVQALDGTAVESRIVMVDWEAEQAQKNGFPHFLLKEIHDQPEALRNALRGRIDDTGLVDLSEVGVGPDVLAGVREVVIVACGSSGYAAQVARYAIEHLARMRCSVEPASEFRYTGTLVDADSLVVAFSQSGETADTLAAARQAKAASAPVIAVTNVLGSALSMEADGVLYMQAGPEISVAATKTFVNQMVCGLLLALHLGNVRGTLDVAEHQRLAAELQEMPALLERTLELEPALLELGQRYAHTHNAMYIGRGINFPVALEGALKLKEISYVHAEGYAAGELKHGPIALLDPDVPVIAIATRSRTLPKMVSNIQEVHSREAPVIALITEDENPFDAGFVHATVPVPACDEMLSPLLNVVPLQLFAYHVAVQRGCDVDQPRNLAKSVTVE